MAELKLQRTLTWVQGTAIAIGAVLGSGVLILPAITAAEAGPVSIVGANYFIGTLGLPHWTMPVTAAVMLFASLALHVRGVKLAAQVQISILLLIAGLMIVAILAAWPHIQVNNFHPLAPNGWVPVGAAVHQVSRNRMETEIRD